MSRGRSWFLGLGCLVVLALLLIGALLVRGISSPPLPGRFVLAVHVTGPLPEIVPDDPFAQLQGGPSFGLRDLRAALVAAADDSRVVGVRLRIDGSLGLAPGEEIRALLGKVRAAGKWTAAYMDTAGEFAPGNGEYFLASACDEISMNPMGDVNLVGLSARVPFIRGTLDKLGIRPEFPGRGAYKTARFFYTERGFTPEDREMTGWLVDSLMDQLVAGVAAGRGLEPAAVRDLIDRAPFLGQEAVDAKLVDRLEDWSDFVARVKDRDNGEVKAIGVADYADKVEGHTSGPKIAVVTAAGTILRGRSGRSFNPLVGDEVMGSETIAKAWRDVRDASGIKAVVFRIDSPGGSAVASEIIRQEMARTSESLPVVVSMSNLAASGGYWITCGAKKIVADPSTLTASIGVFAGHLNMDELFSDRLGVNFGRIDRGANADMYGSLEDWTDAQRAVINRQLDRIYGSFLERVAASRGMSVEAVDEIGRGRVFTGAQAVDKGLVDELGGFDVALDEAKRLAGLDPTAEVELVDFPKPVPFWERLLKRGRDNGTVMDQAASTVATALATGELPLPGVAWMPPITVR